jgi:hypothetical protein
MNTDATSAHARQFKRHAAEFEASIEPHPDHAEQFRLTYANATSGLAVTDVSRGGLGLLSGILFPKSLRVVVHVHTTAHPEGRPLTVRAVVRRCVMIDHKPTYQVGLQFLDPGGVDEQFLVKAVTQAQQSEKQLAGVGAGVS